MTGEVQPQDTESGLVAREWVRTAKRRGTLTERTLEGEQVRARFLDKQGHLQEAAGTVARNDTGQLVVESWTDGVRKQTPVTRDANVDVIRR